MPITYTPPKSKKPKKDRSLGDFFGNAADDVAGALVGLVTAPYYIGKAGYNDVVGNRGMYSGSDLGGMGSAIWTSLKDYYKPLAHGDIGGFASNVYDHPLQLALDALTVATFGAGIAAKGASLVAKGGAAGSRASRLAETVAGLQRVDDVSGLSELGRARMISGSKGAPLPGGGYLVPKTYPLVNSLGKQTGEVPLARNPMVRGRQVAVNKLFDRVGERAPLTNYASRDRRGARAAQAKIDRLEVRETSRSVALASTELDKLPQAARTAIFYRIPGFNTAERYSALVAHRKTALDNPTVDARTKSYIMQDLKRLEDPDVAKEILDPSPETKAVEQAMLDVEERVQVQRQRREAPGYERQRERAEQPLRTIMGDKYQIDPGERIGIITYSERRGGKITPRRGASKGALRAPANTEDLGSTGIAFQHALYKADPARILTSQLKELRAQRIGSNVTYALSISEKYDPTNPEHAAGVRPGGGLTRFTVESAPVRKLDEIAEFVNENIVPAALKDGDKSAQRLVEFIREWREEIGDADAYVMPTASWQELNKQVAQAGKLMSLLNRATGTWRDITLSLKGSFYVNNFLGNLIIGLVSYGPAFALELVRSGSKHSKMGKKIHEAMPDLERGHLDAMAALTEQQLGLNPSKRNPLNLVGILGDKFAHVGAKFTEHNFRRAAAAVEIRKTAKQLAKKDGVDFDTAVTRLLDDADSVDALAEKVYGDMLDYTKLTPFERDYIRPLYPFWNFMRSITGRTIRLTLDEPWKMQVMRAMSQSALAENERGMYEGVKDLPHYLTGLMQIGETEGDETPVLGTYGANPFATPADLAQQAAAIFSGKLASQTQSPLSQVNPYIGSAVEAATGNDLFFNQPLEGSRSSIYASQLAKDFWPVSFADRVAYPNPNSIVRRSPAQIGAQWFGVPLGTFDRGNLDRSQAITAYYAQKDVERKMRREAQRASNQRYDLSFLPVVGS